MKSEKPKKGILKNLAVANHVAAAAYINQMFPVIRECSDSVLDKHYDLTRAISDLYENTPGRVTFRIRKSIGWPAHDALGHAFNRVSAVLGMNYVRTCTNDTETYEWTISKTRSIVVWHKGKVGTFIQLRDSGPYTGVIA